MSVLFRTENNAVYGMVDKNPSSVSNTILGTIEVAKNTDNRILFKTEDNKVYAMA